MGIIRRGRAKSYQCMEIPGFVVPCDCGSFEMIPSFIQLNHEFPCVAPNSDRPIVRLMKSCREP